MFSAPWLQKFLFDPKKTYRIAIAIVTVCASQFAALVLLAPVLLPVFGPQRTAEIVTIATKIASVSTCLVAVLGWLAASGRSIIKAVDENQEPPGAH